MTGDLPPRRRSAGRTPLLSVIGVVGIGAVAGALLLWHAQVGEVLGLGADKEPVVSTVGAPAIGAPPTTTKLVTPTPSRRTTTSDADHADGPAEDDSLQEADEEADAGIA